MKVLLFDIDGTLLQAAPSGRLAFSDALREVTGIEDTLEEIAFHGQTDPIIWGKIRSKHGLDNSNGLENRFFSSYEVHLAHRLHDLSDRGRLCPGIPALLQRLVAAPDVYLSILTGNIEAGANAKLMAFGLLDFFRRGAYGSDHGDRNLLGPIAIKRAVATTGATIRLEQCWVIGDTPWDIACGRAFGGRTLGVGTGSFSPAQLLEAGADHALADLSDLGVVTEVMGLN